MELMKDSSSSSSFEENSNEENNWYEGGGPPQLFVSPGISITNNSDYPEVIGSNLTDDNLSFLGHMQILDHLEETSPKDWNERYHELIKKDSVKLVDSEIELERTYQLRKLAMEFANAATVIGVIIIKELFVTTKSILPVRGNSGIAGGEKFVKCGIFFKFSRDLFGIYGGDSYSIKAAAHELKSTMAISDCRISNIFTPLMALIKYRGHAILAQSILPINRDTLC